MSWDLEDYEFDAVEEMAETVIEKVANGEVTADQGKHYVRRAVEVAAKGDREELKKLCDPESIETWRKGLSN